MILHWTSKFKGLDQGAGKFKLSDAAWNAIGKGTAASYEMIPSAFVCTLPNIAEDEMLYEAEAFAFWFQCIALIVLKDWLSRPYYQ